MILFIDTINNIVHICIMDNTIHVIDSIHTVNKTIPVTVDIRVESKLLW